MVKRGFTIVELIIVITIMGILLVLGVVNLNGSQANARDAERKSDVESIAVALESVYSSGYISQDHLTKIGQYPSTTDLSSYPTNILKDIDINALKAPSVADTSLISATDPSTATPISPLSKDQYIYQPLTKDGLLCTTSSDECRKFNIYCVLENGNTLYPVTSKHQ